MAALSHRLDRTAIAIVDAAVSAAVEESPGCLLRIAEAKVIEADTEAYRDEIESARVSRGVWVDGTRESVGTRSVFARVEPADAVWVDATVDRVADLLAADPDLRAAHHPELGETLTRNELRAAAFGWLARPRDLATLLGELAEAPDDRPERRAVVYVHLHESGLLGGEAVARTNALGPVLVDHLARLVGHARIDLKPVIDLNAVTSVNGYEHPERVKERTRLRLVADVFPHSASLAVRLDHDHVRPYDPGGPPGQTGDHNDAPLTRTHHRAKTHLAYEVEQLRLGVYLWRTPHGLVRLVDHEGTHPLTEGEARLARIVYAA